MGTAIALAHFLGAIIAIVVLGLAMIALAGWESDRNQRIAAEEMSVELGVPVEHLGDPEHARAVIQLAAARFSTEKIQNRLSDLCGWIQSGWGWLGMLLQVGILLGVAWGSITQSRDNAIYAWTIVGVAIFFWIVSMAFGIACRLLTGRFPGQARQARKNLAALIKQQSELEMRARPSQHTGIG